jgi:hypothetical protein
MAYFSGGSDEAIHFESKLTIKYRSSSVSRTVTSDVKTFIFIEVRI